MEQRNLCSHLWEHCTSAWYCTTQGSAAQLICQVQRLLAKLHMVNKMCVHLGHWAKERIINAKLWEKEKPEICACSGFVHLSNFFLKIAVPNCSKWLISLGKNKHIVSAIYGWNVDWPIFLCFCNKMFHFVQVGILSRTGSQLLSGFPVHSLGQQSLWCERPMSNPPSAKTDAQAAQSPGSCAMLSPSCAVIEMVVWFQKRSLRDTCSKSDSLVTGTVLWEG